MEPQHLVRRPGHQQQHDQGRIFDSFWWTGTKTLQWPAKKQYTLENSWLEDEWSTEDVREADLLKLFSRRLTELEGYLNKNKTMTAKSAYRVFFETYDNLQANRKQQGLLLKPKYLDAFDIDTKRLLEEKSKDLRWLVGKLPFLRDIKKFSTELVDHCDDTFRA